MKIAVIKESAANEARVAATPDTVQAFAKLGIETWVQEGAGETSSIPDSAYKEAGAKLHKDAKKILGNADIVIKVQAPTPTEISAMKKGAILVGFLADKSSLPLTKKYASQKVSAFAMELVPRISRAQSMDALSSQSNLAGYKAVIDGVATFGKVVPLMMTAAGRINPANVLVLGAGVAGLQAIATAKRLGAVVSAFDVRPAVKEQVESLGASFVEVEDDNTEDAETSGGYAKEMSKAYQKKQEKLIHETVKNQDLVICTALIPNKPAPVLIPEKMVKDMRPGSVIVDLAVATGGNCPLSQPGKIVQKHGVQIIGYDNMPARVAADASQLYAKNLLNFISPLINTKLKKVKIDFEDEIQQSALLTHDGKVVHPIANTGKSS